MFDYNRAQLLKHFCLIETLLFLNVELLSNLLIKLLVLCIFANREDKPEPIRIGFRSSTMLSKIIRDLLDFKRGVSEKR